MRKFLKIVSVVIVGSLWLAGGSAFAQPTAAKAAAAKAPAPEPVETKLERHKISTVGGKEVAGPAAEAKPGDILEDVVTYTNKSKDPVTQFEATLPIPPNTELVMSSTNPAGVKASLDGVTFASLPLKRKFKQPNGVEVEKLVPLSEYRFLRWYPGALAAGKSLVVSARFKVADK